jgi:hypothetical protein
MTEVDLLATDIEDDLRATCGKCLPTGAICWPSMPCMTAIGRSSAASGKPWRAIWVSRACWCPRKPAAMVPRPGRHRSSLWRCRAIAPVPFLTSSVIATLAVRDAPSASDLLRDQARGERRGPGRALVGCPWEGPADCERRGGSCHSGATPAAARRTGGFAPVNQGREVLRW